LSAKNDDIYPLYRVNNQLKSFEKNSSTTNMKTNAKDDIFQSRSEAYLIKADVDRLMLLLPRVTWKVSTDPLHVTGQWLVQSSVLLD